MPAEPGIFKSPLDRDISKLPECPIYDFLRQKIIERGMDKTDKPWVVDTSTGTTVYFKDIDPHSRNVGSALTRLGFKHRDILYFVTYETSVLYLIQLGVWRIGGGARGGFQGEAPEEFARQMIEAKARFVLVDKETYPKMLEAVKLLSWPVSIISFDDVGNPDVVLVKSLIEDDGTALPEKVNIKPKEDVICIPNTSGSTGLPKGVCHTHFGFTTLNFDPRAIDVFKLPFMTPMSNYAVGSFMVTTSSLYYGSTVFHLGRFQKENYFELMVKNKPGNVLMYPFVANWFARCDDIGKYDLSFLKLISIVGSVLDPTTAQLINQKLPGAKIVLFYGMSEMINISNTQLDTLENEIAHDKIATKENQGELCVTSGKLVPYVVAKILDVNTGNTLGPNERGELYVKSPMLMKGYLREGHEMPVIENVTEDGFFKTGDIAFFDENSNIYILERTSFLFKYYMFIVSPTEIETCIKQHPDVLEVGVVDIPNPECTSVARAFIRKKPNSKCTEADLVKFVADRLPEHKQLHGGVQFVDKLPESKGNKLDRIALKKMALDK
ncbi:uncharacterized protein LOC135934273 [Cloeon dipterum]|uniref:uncharacterized protein LOC135934273 n=1 Tax=Cloeon dipterum TaxID=197152 RepID=UPI0032207A46